MAGEVVSYIMSELLQAIGTTAGRFDLRSFIDILIIAFIVYWLLLMLRRTTAMALLRGVLLVLLVAVILSNALQLTVLGWLLRNSLPALLVAIPILFQPELRRALEQVGRGLRGWMPNASVNGTLDQISRACLALSERRYGALIVLERETGLQEYIEGGVQIDAAVSPELLVGLFFPKSPLHDGAVIVRADRIVAARCFLPLSENLRSDHRLGTRHRAALGISECTDAISLVISEETGNVSVATSGRMIGRLDEARLRGVLAALYAAPRRLPFAGAQQE